MYQLILTLHIIIAFLLIAFVLLHQPQSGGMGTAFGAGASQTVFGSQGANTFLFKLVASIGALFFLISVALTYLVAHQHQQQRHNLGFEVPKTATSVTPNSNEVSPQSTTPTILPKRALSDDENKQPEAVVPPQKEQPQEEKKVQQNMQQNEAKPKKMQ